MKSFSSPSALARHVALALVVFGLSASCTDDALIARQDDDPDAGSIPEVDGSKPPTPRPDGSAGPRCGDGEKTAGEECDDGNAISGDGCSIACKTEAVSTLPEDACPGAELALTANGNTRSATVSGSNAALNPNYETTCGGGNGKDAIYKITSDRPGRAVATLTADFAGLLSLRGSCDPANGETTCKAATAEGQAVELVFPLAAAQTVFVVVDALAGGVGNYTLDVKVTDSACGDGIAQLPEQCDDGNVVAGDGCSGTCQFEDPPSQPGTCPGASYTIVGNAAAPVTVSFAGDLLLQENTSGARNCSPSVSPSWSSGGRDQVYAITPTISGALRTTLYPSFPRPSLHMREECFQSDTELACTTSLVTEPITISRPVVANQTYFLFADNGFAESGISGGPYTLDVTLSPATCGNGIVETPEQCDDNGTAPGDGCDANCQLEPSLGGIESCPGANIPFVTGPGDTRTFRTFEDTSRLSADVWAACNASQSPTATISQTTIKDAVYSFVAPYDGYLEADLEADFVAAMDLRTTCVSLTQPAPGTSTGSVACDSVDEGSGPVALRRPVASGQQYFLIVKGGTAPANTNQGAYHLDLRLRPAVCGNGIIEGVETCDDGPWPVGWNHESGCTASCTVAPMATTGVSCSTADPVVLEETAAGSGVYRGVARGGNWNRPHVSGSHPGCSTAGTEQHFLVTSPVDGVLVARTSNGTFPITLGAWATCTVPTNPIATSLGASCFGNVPEQEFSRAVAAGAPTWLSVDGRTTLAGGKGRFELEVVVGPPACGDGILAGAEQCDDGNVLAGDGCSATCTLEPAPGSDVCPGLPVTLTDNGTGSYTALVTVGTGDAQANYGGTCGGAGRDRVLQLVAPIDGNLSARLNGQGWGAVMYAREACSDTASQLTNECEEPNPARPNEFQRLLEFPVVAGQPIFLFADGNAGQSGPATIQIVITP